MELIQNLFLPLLHDKELRTSCGGPPGDETKGIERVIWTTPSIKFDLNLMPLTISSFANKFNQFHIQ